MSPAHTQAPREVWDHPLFVHLNVILTVAFGLMFCGCLAEPTLTGSAGSR